MEELWHWWVTQSHIIATYLFLFFRKEEKIKTLRQSIQNEFSLDDGPFIKSVKSCLDLLGVCQQPYYGGIFVGNHVHKILQVCAQKQIMHSIHV